MKSYIAIIALLTFSAVPTPAQRPVQPLPPRDVVDVERAVARASADAARSMELAQGELRLAQADLDHADHFIGIPGRRAESALVVADEAWPAEKLGEAREDGAIMLKLLQGALREDRGESADAWAMGIHLEEIGVGRQSRVLYLDGFGAMFQLNASIPLVAPPENKSKEESKQVEDSAWERARRDLYGRPGRPRPPGGRRERAFSAEAVARLKTSLVDALGSAANLRHVKDDEYVVVAVTGSSSGAGHRVERTEADGNVEVHVETRVVTGGPEGFEWVGDNQAGRAPSTMTLKVKKSDALAFAAKQISRDEFGGRVKVATY